MSAVLAPVAPAPQHTAGPWRWEISRQSKRLHLVGGKPMFDLTIMDFERWGMSNATVMLRDTAHDGFNLMHKLHERPDWIAPFPGRAHHASWCSNVIHPDMRLIAAAPELLAELRETETHLSEFITAIEASGLEAGRSRARLNSVRGAIAKATGAP